MALCSASSARSALLRSSGGPAFFAFTLSDMVDLTLPVSAGAAVSILSIALAAFAMTSSAVTPGHPRRIHRQMVVLVMGRPAAVNLAATLRMLGFARLSQTALASAGVGLSLMGACATFSAARSDHPLRFHFVMMSRQTCRP